jgi:hypothetical protein
LHSTRRDGSDASRLWERASLGASACFVYRGGHRDAPLDLGADHIDDLVRQAGNVLVAEVDGDAGLLLLDFSWGGLGGGAEVAAGMFESGLCQRNNGVVGDGRGRVVAHCGRRQREPGDAAERRADMLRGNDEDNEGVSTSPE